ncbi:Ribonuclease H [Abeliophyllum distichum]|uniref:Ribonuclease H n=1 Tax=Abeliophyllum distichum TaxID=126358 RepID=A0ABD1UQS9_9LAMI
MCYVENFQIKNASAVLILDFEPPIGRIEPLDMTEKIQVTDGKEFNIGTDLPPEQMADLIKGLMDNIDVFAWNPSDILGISSSIAQHRLGTFPEAKLVKQKNRNFAPDR